MNPLRDIDVINANLVLTWLTIMSLCNMFTRKIVLLKWRKTSS